MRGSTLVGILSNGHQDYVDKGNCRVANVCKGSGCSGKADTITYVRPVLRALCASPCASTRLCARAFTPASFWSRDYNNSQGWNVGPDLWQAIQFPDLDGERGADVCGRTANGPMCGTVTTEE